MLIMMVFLLLLPLQIILQKSGKKHVNAFLCGANIADAKDPRRANDHFYTVQTKVAELKLSNYYAENWFGEKKLGGLSAALAAVLLAALVVVMFL
jgi:hypothetical protein